MYQFSVKDLALNSLPIPYFSQPGPQRFRYFLGDDYIPLKQPVFFAFPRNPSGLAYLLLNYSKKMVCGPI